jgi:hypothetical protein
MDVVFNPERTVIMAAGNVNQLYHMQVFGYTKEVTVI